MSARRQPPSSAKTPREAFAIDMALGRSGKMYPNPSLFARPEGKSMAAPKRVSARPKLSAGILAYRRRSHGLEVLLVHPGGPYWRNKDAGAWSIPKGEIEPSEDPEQAARREFSEELGPAALIGPLQALGEIRQRGGKRVIAFWAEADFDTASLSSNSFEIEWPPRSGALKTFPEVDRAEWFELEVARSKILSGQVELIDRLEKQAR
jgi:predicted NUDIX family NTP pyrophosphohydrolase